ncbi:MAGE family-domain-containing protein [Scheffersomyces xylosifermentans]|uniref:MAGE family-domain-containing protein n=1 Tax=Scheffersomyces xylosifermentans TaxID=1304137 RepID=UPI00315DEBDE
MPRRRRVANGEEDEESDFDEGHTEDFQESSESRESDFNRAVDQVVRLVLGRELKGNFIRREHIAGVVNVKKFGLDSLITETKKTLENVYGLTLVEVPVVKKRDDKKPGRVQKASTTNKGKQPYAIVNCLAPQSRKILGELWLNPSNFEAQEPDVHSEKYFIPKYKKTDAPLSNYELVKTGIMLYIISLIILSENYLHEVDIIRNLKKMGISENLNEKNSAINMNLQELLSELIRKEYIVKETAKGAVESEDQHNYTLGRRSLVEFPPENVVEYIKEIYGEKFDSERTVFSIERAYGVKLPVEKANEDTGNDNSESNAPSIPVEVQVED